MLRNYQRIGGAAWTPARPEVGLLSVVVIVCSMAINYAVATYEHRRGRALKSAVLVADAHHTHSDVYGSLAVLLSLGVIRLGYTWFDIVATLFIVGLIGRAVWHILSDSLHTLVDISRLPVEQIAALALRVPGVRECHNICSRGLEDAVYIDFTSASIPTSRSRQRMTLAVRLNGRFSPPWKGLRMSWSILAGTHTIPGHP